MDLPAYLERIHYQGPLDSTLETLAGLHLAHTSSIPFENLDIQLGRRIHLDLAALQAKLVQARRGGYCFEHNTLFAAALQALGFTVTLREARVSQGGGQWGLRNHLAPEVQLPGGPWLADVGFGGDGSLGPVPLDGSDQAWFGDHRRILPQGHRQVLQAWDCCNRLCHPVPIPAYVNR